MGYLVLSIDTTAYASIPGGSPFIRPVDPGVFSPVTIPGLCAPDLTPGEIVTEKFAFDKQKR